MKGQKTEYVCSNCGGNFAKWVGKCTDCGTWNSLQETLKDASSHRYSNSWTGQVSEVKKLHQISSKESIRVSTKIPELDRVLGGGMAESSVILLGGDPGIGKSTLLLQVCNNFIKQNKKVLYVSGEESLAQIADRAKRLNCTNEQLDLLGENRLEKVLLTIEDLKPDLVIIDSIQTIYTSELQAAPGSVSQVRECAAHLTRVAKAAASADACTSLVLVGHVTKEGAIAGPRVLEHMVDTVLYFEGDSGGSLRMIRAIKNRFGAVNELGLFTMTAEGLMDLTNPSEMLITPHSSPVSGSVVLASLEGNRPFLVEIQALIEDSVTANPKRYAVGLDTNKLQMILAILNKHAGISSFDKNVYAQTTGGIKITETGVDLAIALCCYSSLAKKPLPLNTAIFGELGLTGELRPVPNAEARMKECQKLGYKKLIIPKRTAYKKEQFKDLSIYEYDKISGLLAALSRGELS